MKSERDKKIQELGTDSQSLAARLVDAIEFTSHELAAVRTVLYDEVYCGDDENVYGNGAQAVSLRLALEKVEDAIERQW